MTSAIVRREIGRTQGFEVKTEGDAFMVAFADALNAVQFALHVQLRLRDAKWPTWLLADPALAEDAAAPRAVSECASGCTRATWCRSSTRRPSGPTTSGPR